MLAVLVFNLAAGALLVLAGGAAGATYALGQEPWAIVAGFAAMTLAGAALELRPAWRPRYFWVIPGWLTGLAGVGGVLVDKQLTAGYVVLGVAALLVVAQIGHAIARKPGGKWLAGVVGASSIVAGFQVIGYARPEWKHPVLYVVNALALVAAIACGVQLYRARQVEPRR